MQEKRGKIIMTKFDIMNLKLSTLSEKELLIEILLELKELNNQGKRIASNQVIWSD